MKVFIVLPTYNEANNIGALVAELTTSYPGINLIVVDDNSPDGTGAIADALAKKNGRIQVVHRPGKAGLGTAYLEGFKMALAQGAELVFEMDSDFSHDPRYIEEFLKASRDADLVIGSRYINGVRVEGWSFRRLMLSKAANIFTSRILLRPVWDFTSGYRCYRRKVLEQIDLESIRSDGYAFQIEMIHQTFKHNFRVTEIPIIFKERKSGASKISRSIKREAFLLVLRCHAPLLKLLKHVRFFLENSEDFFNRISHIW